MDGSTVDDAQVAADIWAASQPHAPTALLAYLYRNNLPFPQTGIPPVAPRLGEILTICKWEVQRWGFEYFRFHCPACQSYMFEPASQDGMRHALRVARLHQVVRGTNPLSCCQQRATKGIETVFPDSLEA